MNTDLLMNGKMQELIIEKTHTHRCDLDIVDKTSQGIRKIHGESIRCTRDGAYLINGSSVCMIHLGRVLIQILGEGRWQKV